MPVGILCIPGFQRGLAQQKVGGGVLTQHFAFAALQGVEAAGGEQIESLLRVASFIKQRGELHRGVVAFQNECAVAFQKPQADQRAVTQFGTELHKFGTL